MGAHPTWRHTVYCRETQCWATLFRAERPIHCNHLLLPDFSERESQERDGKLPRAPCTTLITAFKTREGLHWCADEGGLLDGVLSWKSPCFGDLLSKEQLVCHFSLKLDFSKAMQCGAFSEGENLKSYSSFACSLSFNHEHQKKTQSGVVLISLRGMRKQTWAFTTGSKVELRCS